MMRRASALLALLLLFAPVATAQETRGSIEGVVKDNTGAVLPGVTVEARNAQGGVTTAVSDNVGKYRFPSLTPGRYAVTANLAGSGRPPSTRSTSCSARSCSSISRSKSAASPKTCR